MALEKLYRVRFPGGPLMYEGGDEQGAKAIYELLSQHSDDVKIEVSELNWWPVSMTEELKGTT